jgi:hypothetical protein
MYVDEVGNPDLRSCYDQRHRHLSLTGVIMELGYVDAVVFPEIEEMKRRFFRSHADDPVVLHRKDLVNAHPPFDGLRDEAVRQAFDDALLDLLAVLDYVVITVVIDKQAHVEQYTVWRYDPYHYCMKVLVERYVMWLQGARSSGDVMAESRGGKEDMRLKASFLGLTEGGTEHVGADTISRWLTSKQLKVKPKSNNIAGLQLADLIAHPSFKAVQARRDRCALPNTFGGRVAQILERDKYRRSPDGRIDGWGRKWLP